MRGLAASHWLLVWAEVMGEKDQGMQVSSLCLPDAAVWYMDPEIVLESTSKSAIYLLKNSG